MKYASTLLLLIFWISASSQSITKNDYRAGKGINITVNLPKTCSIGDTDVYVNALELVDLENVDQHIVHQLQLSVDVYDINDDLRLDCSYLYDKEEDIILSSRTYKVPIYEAVLDRNKPQHIYARDATVTLVDSCGICKTLAKTAPYLVKSGMTHVQLTPLR